MDAFVNKKNLAFKDFKPNINVRSIHYFLLYGRQW